MVSTGRDRLRKRIYNVCFPQKTMRTHVNMSIPNQVHTYESTSKHAYVRAYLHAHRTKIEWPPPKNEVP